MFSWSIGRCPAANITGESYRYFWISYNKYTRLASGSTFGYGSLGKLAVFAVVMTRMLIKLVYPTSILFSSSSVLGTSLQLYASCPIEQYARCGLLSTSHICRSQPSCRNVAHDKGAYHVDNLLTRSDTVPVYKAVSKRQTRSVLYRHAQRRQLTINVHL